MIAPKARPTTTATPPGSHTTARPSLAPVGPAARAQVAIPRPFTRATNSREKRSLVEGSFSAPSEASPTTEPVNSAPPPGIAARPWARDPKKPRSASAQLTWPVGDSRATSALAPSSVEVSRACPMFTVPRK